MKLKDYMIQQKIKGKDLFTKTGISIGAISRYKNGPRVPEPDYMRRLFFWSNGTIQPNDFYPMDEWRKELEADNQN